MHNMNGWMDGRAATLAIAILVQRVIDIIVQYVFINMTYVIHE